MFGMYHWFYEHTWHALGRKGTNPAYSLQGPNSVPTVIFAGLLTGTCEAICFTPCERVQALLQAKEYNTRFEGFFQTAVRLREYGGFKEYYRGFSAIALRNGPQTALFFLLKPHVTGALTRDPAAREEGIARREGRPVELPPWTVDFCSGAAIGAFGSTIFYPLGVAKARMQRQLGGELVSPLRVLQSLSIAKLYTGVSTNLIRAVASWGIINASYEFLIGRLVQERD